jgi:hypothetical protein
MMELTSWQADARVAVLDEIMVWALEHYAVDHMLVALRLIQIGNRWRYADPQAGEVFQSQFGPYILTGFQAAQWPGTELFGHPGFVYVVRFNEEVKEVVIRTQPSLAKWQHGENPPLPEDICLFREADSHPVLVTCTHGLDAWLISHEKPELQGFRRSNISPEKLFPKGKYFCRKFNKGTAGDETDSYSYFFSL